MKWTTDFVKMGQFKTQLKTPLSSRNESASLDGKEVSSGGLKMYKEN